MIQVGTPFTKMRYIIFQDTKHSEKAKKRCVFFIYMHYSVSDNSLKMAFKKNSINEQTFPSSSHF